jgi:photosystem II stability/assembly factor-like uncharacterized protein
MKIFYNLLREHLLSERYFTPIYIKMHRLKLKLLLFIPLLSVLIAIPLNAQWKQVKLGQPGKVWCVGADSDNIFAGNFAGIYRSTNQGKSWTNVSPYFAKCFAVKGAEIFAGTYLNGLVRSTDGGATWHMTDSSMTQEIDAIAIKDNYIFAGGGGMFRSTDDGLTWTTIENGLGFGQSMVTGMIVTEGKILASTYAGVVASTDDGDNWSDVAGTNSSNDVTNCIAVIDSVVLVGWNGGIIRSTDDGRSWVEPGGWINTSTTYSIIGDSSRIYAGTVDGVHVSTDSGKTWISVSSGLPGNQVFSLAADDTNLFGATDNNGVYISSDNGESWSPTGDGIITSSINSLGGYGANIFAVMNYDSLFISSNNGTTWAKDTSLQNVQVQSVKVFGSDAFALTDSGIYHSSNDFKTWERINNTVTIAFTAAGANLLIGAAGGVLLSTDGGQIWKSESGSPSRVNAFCTYGLNVFAATDAGIYRSTDEGQNWVHINDTLENISSLAANGSTIIAGRFEPPTPGGSPIPPPGGIFISNDNGNSWMPYGAGLPKYPQVYTLAAYNSRFFAGLEAGFGNQVYPGTIYSSTLNQTNWNNAAKGYPFVSTMSIYINDSSVFAGTVDAGVWKEALPPISGIKKTESMIFPKSFMLLQNYPNPFNPSTRIDYSLPVEGKVKLEVFDIMGRRITTLVNKNQSAGVHSVTFNGSNLASGVYFYRLIADRIVVTKKLMLIK